MTHRRGPVPSIHVDRVLKLRFWCATDRARPEELKSHDSNASSWAIFRSAPAAHHFLLWPIECFALSHWWSKIANRLHGAWLFRSGGTSTGLPADWRCGCGSCENPRSEASSGAQGPDRVVALDEIEERAQRRAAFGLQVGVAFDHQSGIVARRLQEVGMRRQIGQSHVGQAALARTQELAGTAQAQVLLGNAKAVLALAHDGEPRPRGLAQGLGVEQQEGRLGGAPADAAAQLVELGE